MLRPVRRSLDGRGVLAYGILEPFDTYGAFHSSVCGMDTAALAATPTPLPCLQTISLFHEAHVTFM